jgi:branched-chain amino acid transport system ATP-binding protein
MSGLLEIDKLCVWYGPVFALKDATLSVGSGEAVALIGANGAGKSTLFKSIVGFLRPKSGALRFLDRDVTGLRTEQRIRLGLGYSPEGRRVFPGLTVRENLEVAVFAGKAERARRVDRGYTAGSAGVAAIRRPAADARDRSRADGTAAPVAAR